jgi:AraC-like DNA-binding protein
LKNDKHAIGKQRMERSVQGRGRLQRITAWESLATQACYSGTELARISEVSLRHLQRYIRARYGMTLDDWISGIRIRHGYQQLAQGITVKETAFSLGFKQVSHFSRSFKKHYGFNPSTVPISIGSASNNQKTVSQDDQPELCLFQGGFPQRKK